MLDSDGKDCIWTIGHSTRSSEQFLDLLEANGIEVLADVRRFAGSRRYPQFHAEALRESLGAAKIAYVPMPELGGRRQPLPNSPNPVWRNESFRGYADYMETDEFREAVSRLMSIAAKRRSVMMCAEAVWWRCHRALIADYLKAQGMNVIHILGLQKNEMHPYTKSARVVEGDLTYHCNEQPSLF